MASKSKSYRDNPALQFISTAMVEEAQETMQAPVAPPIKAVAPTKASEIPAVPQGPAASMAAPTPTFTPVAVAHPVLETPAVAAPSQPVQVDFAATAAPAVAPAGPVSPAPGYVMPGSIAGDPAAFGVPMKPVYVEVRSKRFNALLQPSLYRNLSALAAQDGISVNELMHQALEQYVRARSHNGV